MQAARPQGWMRSILSALALAALVSGPLVGLAPRLEARDAAPMASAPTAAVSTTAMPVTAAAEISADKLKELFVGRTPSGLAELKAMQGHVQKLIDTLSKCTVGVQVGNAQGSGVIVSKDGYVLTAAHVAGEPNRNAAFILSDGRTVRGTTLGLFKTLDAGLMKITEDGEYPFAEMGSSENLRSGQWCLALGHPGGYQSDRGVVLRLGRILTDWDLDEVITTDCTLVGGDSGGPLFDMDGKVIGINSRIAGSLEANMHAPVAAFQETWDRLKNGDAWGHYPGQKPWIGVRGEEGTGGARIARVERGSPAAQAGIEPGDIIIKFGDKDIADFKALVDAVSDSRPNRRVTVKVQRGEEVRDLRLKIGVDRAG